ncbi:MAG: hypothetical protein AAGB51_01015 [Planctomycetota bacterium]
MTLRPEVEAWIEADICEPAELLRCMSVDTPRSIFPGRRIGSFDVGFEASLLVLDDNPLEDPAVLLAPQLGIKQGHMILREVHDIAE